MFRFIHAADIHLDSPLRGLSRYESAPAESIRNACRRAFENLVDRAIEEQVAFVLLAGDLYDGDWKDYSTGIFLKLQVGRLGQHGIRVFAVLGNHDAANKMTKTLEPPANMTILSSRKVETILADDLSVAIHGRSFGQGQVSENLAANFPAAKDGLFNIGLLHTSLDGREGHAPYAPCTVDDLRSKGYQYWALGHVHKYEVVSRDPWIVFPGCIQGRHIKETGPKGCVLVTVDGGAVKEVENIPLDVLRWAFCRVDVTDVADVRDVLNRVRRHMEAERDVADGRPIAMRIRFEGTTGLCDELAAYPERLEQEVRALGAEIAGEDLWVERVENAATNRMDLDSVLSDDTVFGEMLNEILATPGGPQAIDGLEQVIDDLRRKVPPEALRGASPLSLDDAEFIHGLVEEAKHLLVGRLLGAGGAR